MTHNHQQSALIIEEIKYRIEYVPNGASEMNIAMASCRPVNPNYNDGLMSAELHARGAETGFIDEPRAESMPLSTQPHRLSLPKDRPKYFFDQTPVERLKDYGFMSAHLVDRQVVDTPSPDCERVTIEVYGDTTAIDPRAVDAVCSYLRTLPSLEREVANANYQISKMARDISRLNKENASLTRQNASLNAELYGLYNLPLVRLATSMQALWYKVFKPKK